MSNDLLLKINNQCAIVQKTIATHFDTPNTPELADALTKLRGLLEACTTLKTSPDRDKT